MKSIVITAVLLVTSQASAVQLGPKAPFDYQALLARAEAAAKKPYTPPPEPNAPALASLTGEVAASIHFRSEQALWADVKDAPKIQFFHRNTYFRENVRYYVVENGQQREVIYASALFDYGATRLDQTLPKDLGFAGFRVMNKHNPETDWLAFLGASYFRTAQPFDQYGLSARAVTVDSGFTDEEFPKYTDMWFERRGADLRLTGYVDGPSIVGVIQFDVHMDKAKTCIMDVHTTMYARKDIRRLGLAPLTSMYWFGERDRRNVHDWHPEAHDSDELVIRTASGEQIARPLQNPNTTSLTSFAADDVRGFGLLQRDRDPEHYLDELFRYELRGSAWIEPTQPFGPGSVYLLELATAADVNDNIVTYWVPKDPVKAGSKYTLAYKLYWAAAQPNQPAVAQVWTTRTGRGGGPANEETRRFAVEFMGGALDTMPEDATLVPIVTTARGTVERPSVIHVPHTKRWRALFDLRGGGPPGSDPIDIRMFIKHGNDVVSETWLYQYRPGDDG